MAKVWRNDIVLCVCCAVMTANGDESGCLDYDNHEPHAMRAPGIDMSVCVTGDSHEVYTLAAWTRCYGCDQPMEYGQTVFDAVVLR